ncbi:hypothetical protein AVEN_14436-1 [Araneus ventricosus]|uniref:Uncharacterized protein n=1 Tax=Araneus ventricosus TaxID=182803 RepID=A0A4Y2V638_ARAVE|nr:hypothetical protein AVEN_14436-1 [Araneus ventricosus]
MNWTLPTWVVILPHHPTPAITSPYGARKWAVVGNDNWTPYRAYLRSDLRTSPPLKEANRLRPTFIAVKGKYLDRLARQLVLGGFGEVKRSGEWAAGGVMDRPLPYSRSMGMDRVQ